MADKALPALKELGRKRGLEIGTAFSGNGLAAYRAVIRRHADIVTPEWCLKPSFLKPDASGSYRFAEADATYRFCRDASIGVHGHTLFWHSRHIGWADHTRLDVVLERYGGFLKEVVGRYPDTVSWDVVNEIVSNERGGLLRAQKTLDSHGLGFVAALFKRVRALAPSARLSLNDYNLECGGGWCTDKRERLLNVVTQLADKGAPVDAIGIQGHLSSRFGTNVAGVLRLCDALAKRGIAVFLTEIDVNDVDLADDVDARDRQVARIYRDFLSGVLVHPAIKRVAFWGLWDGDHWLVRYAHPNTRAPGLGRPALFDAGMKAKPAFYAVAAALEAAPARG